MEHQKKMNEVGKKLHADNIAAIKYVVARDIGEGIHKITNGHEMIKELERIGFIRENSYDDLIKILDTQKRNDLISIINGESQPESVFAIFPERASVKLKNAPGR
ncbi:uncharacterized protein LOC136073164 isoform X1 [Hydra vulgaris]|uniref:uncharacterized protein LOC136073164 isoform X1 n=1 Tax=Hydra vulgaris TaxID=6087 RepID=UPI0032EA1176